jgi:hypothetical protein
MSSFRSKRFGRAQGRRHLHHRLQVRGRRLALVRERQQSLQNREASPARNASPLLAMPPNPPEAPRVPVDPAVRNPDEVLFPAPFRDPADFAPIPPPQARLADLVELLGHTGFVVLVTVVLPLLTVWAGYRLYRWLPFETMALLIVSAAALWAYRDRLLPLVKRIVLGRGD